MAKRASFLEWLEDKAPQLGAVLAYYTVFSLAPLILVLRHHGGGVLVTAIFFAIGLYLCSGAPRHLIERQARLMTDRASAPSTRALHSPCSRGAQMSASF